MGAFSDFLSDVRVQDALRKARSILVVGDVDTGKTTLVTEIARNLLESFQLGICDLDVGQSSIGPPTTVGWGKVEGEVIHLEDIHPRDIYFTGTFSPEGNLLPCITGAKLVSGKASLHCEKVIIDTTGYLCTPAARALKEYKIDLLEPEVVIGIERKNEISTLLSPYSSNDSPRIFRLPPPDVVKQKTPEMRARFREKRFFHYFSGAITHKITLNRKRIRFTRQSVDTDREELAGRIVSFRDRRNRDIALGIVREVDRKGDTLLVDTPVKGRMDFTTLVVGVAKASIPESL